jgi:mono/diheme cytochrome c family protein
MTPLADKNDPPPVVGILAEFDGPEALKGAAAGLRAAGYARYEAYSPYPVHGLYAAMGRKRTVLPRLVLAGGIAGCLGALLLQWWTNAVDYPHWISGKPLFSLPANIPITFELLILLGALAAFGGGLALGNLPELYHPIFGCAEFRRVSTDAFFLAVDAADPRFDETGTADLLRSLGARNAEAYCQPRTERRIPGYVMAAMALLMALALLPPLWIAKVRYARKASPRIHLVLDMDFQPKYLPQQYSPLFEDRRDMRPPVPGTVAVDAAIGDAHLLGGEVDGKPADAFPMPVSSGMMQRGRRRYEIFCATCHGLAGDGDGITSQLAFEREEPKWVRPLSLHNPSVRQQPVGQLYKTITEGIRTMPSYRGQIPVEDRWAVILYVRALQRSRNATMENVPEELRKHLKLLKETPLPGRERGRG